MMQQIRYALSNENIRFKYFSLQYFDSTKNLNQFTSSENKALL